MENVIIELKGLSNNPIILTYRNSVEEQDVPRSKSPKTPSQCISCPETGTETEISESNTTLCEKTIHHAEPDWRVDSESDSDSDYNHNHGNSVRETIDLNSFKNSVTGALFGLFLVVLDWVLDLSAAGFHFLNGHYYYSSLTLITVFVGGLIVTLNLNFLIHRKGDKEFKNELRRICRILPYAMGIPSLSPFFSCGLRVYVAYQLRHANDTLEIKRLEELMKICIQHMTTDLLYERCYEAFPQAILQTVILLEKPIYISYLDFVPLVCVLLTWCSLSLSPFQISKTVNKIQFKPQLVIAGFANKGITLLTFTLVITSSRTYFCDPEENCGDTTLIMATVAPFIVLTIVSDLPGFILFESERQFVNNSRFKRKLQHGMNMLASVIPMVSLFSWIFTLSLETTYKSRNIVVLAVFLLGWVISLGELCDNVNYTWLGQFSTDMIILFYIGFLSYFKEIEFHKINFQYVSPQTVQDMGNL